MDGASHGASLSVPCKSLPLLPNNIPRAVQRVSQPVGSSSALDAGAKRKALAEEDRTARMLRRRGELLIADDGVAESDNDGGNEPQETDAVAPSPKLPPHQSSVAAVGEDLEGQFGFIKM